MVCGQPGCSPSQEIGRPADVFSVRLLAKIGGRSSGGRPELCRASQSVECRFSRYWRSTQRLLCSFVLLVPVYAAAQPRIPDYQVKAAFLYHFTQFVEWPLPNNRDPFLMCVADSPATGAALEQLTRHRFVEAHPIQVLRVTASSDVHNCRLLFIAVCSKTKLQQLLANVHDLSLLTIGEQSGFVDAGGMVELFRHDERIVFTISPEAMQKVHLNASSKLLRLARPAGSLGEQEYR